eukprot:TRINITY_DN34129_c0_g1_i1.p2 TRINITY_DN34129_c0_g1~~TRINITY_DN34129_c0_g1_i1.p2  ORF type:complete len:179 (+),score=82.14 TRINITY_DN34129_c0_g1_i1:57-593(+)
MAAVLLLGGAASGMTTLVEQLQRRCKQQLLPGRCMQGLQPTVGVNKHRLSPGGHPVLLTEVGGKMAVHNHKQLNPGGFLGILYVVDMSAPAALALAAVELHNVLAHEQVARVPVMVVLNKVDAASTVPRGVVDAALALPLDREPQLSVAEASGATGRGVHRIVDWLAQVARSGEARDP